jgi:Immunity protein 49
VAASGDARSVYSAAYLVVRTPINTRGRTATTGIRKAVPFTVDAEMQFTVMNDDTASFIAGHDPKMSREELVEQAHERIEDFDALRESLPERPRNLSSFARDAHALAGLFHRIRPDAPEILLFLRIMARAIAADAARLIPGGGPVRVDLGKLGPIELPPTNETPPLLLRLRHITDAYHAAFAAGDKPALALLATAPFERIARTPPTAEESSYLLLHARGLQMLAGDDIGGNDLLLGAIKGCESPAMIEATRNVARLLASPEIELALLYGEDDREARDRGLPTFDEALRNALVWHRHYWTDFEPNPGEHLHRHPEGFIALGPLAWATLRRDASLPFSMTSDYLPRSVIESHK